MNRKIQNIYLETCEISNNNDFKLPYYILPIASLKKKIYQEGDESFIGSENIIISDVDTELVEKYNSMYADGNGYIKSLESLFNTKYVYLLEIIKYMNKVLHWFGVNLSNNIQISAFVYLSLLKSLYKGIP